MVLRVDVGRQRHLRTCHLEDLLAATTSGFGNHLRHEAAGRSSADRHVGTVGRGDQITPSLARSRSISTSNWFRSSRVVVAAAEAARDGADASISSMKRKQGRSSWPARTCRARARRRRRRTSRRSRSPKVKNGTLASPDRAPRISVLRCQAADQQHARGNPPPSAELPGSRRTRRSLQVLLGLVHAGDVLEGDCAVPLGQHLGARLAEAHGLADAPCICATGRSSRRSRDKGTTTPGRRRTNLGTLSPAAGGDRDLAVRERLISVGLGVGVSGAVG